MSFGYSQKLSYKEDLGGSFGKPEVVEPTKELLRKALLLADWVSGACVSCVTRRSCATEIVGTELQPASQADQRGKKCCRLYWRWYLDELWHTGLQVSATSSALTGSSLIS